MATRCYIRSLQRRIIGIYMQAENRERKSAERKRKQFIERSREGRYRYPKEQRNKYMREHRRYKRKLYEDGLIGNKEK
jgi:hypothetical protein